MRWGRPVLLGVGDWEEPPLGILPQGLATPLDGC